MVDVTSRLRLVVDSSGVDKAGKKLRDVRQEAKQLDDMAKQLRGAFLSLGAAFAGTQLASEVIKLGDAWKRAENQMKTVEKTLGAVRTAQEGVFQVAQRTFSAYDSTAALYTKLQRSSAGLIKSQQEALRVTETVNKLMAIGGANTGERNAAILQLGQALGSGRLQGDEFRSISENAPLILDALAASTGKARGELKALGSEGKITSEVLIKALQDFAEEADAAFANFTPTIADAWTNLMSAFEKLVGERGSGIFAGIASAIQAVATNLELIAKLATVAGAALAAAFVGKVAQGIAATVSQMVALEIALGATSTAAALQGVALKGLQGAWRALTAVMASNPFGLIAVAITAALVALYEFGDALTVETGSFVSDVDELKGKTLEYKVTVQDVMAAIPGVVGDGLKSLVDTFGGWIDDLFGTKQMVQVTIFLTQVFETAKVYFNAIVSLTVAALGTIIKNWSKMPAVFGDIFMLAVQAALQPVEWLVNKIIEAINGLITKANGAAGALNLPFQIPTLGLVEFADASVKAGSALGGLVSDFQNFHAAASNVDWLGSVGEFGAGAVKALVDKAREIAKRRAEAEQMALGGMSGSGGSGATTKEAIDKEAKKLAERLKEQTAAYKQLFSEAARMRDAAMVSDDEVEIVDRMLGLLDRFPLLYEAMGDQAERKARADAESLISMEKQAKAASALRQIQKDLAVPASRAAAYARGGYRELEISDKTREMIESGAFNFDENNASRTAEQIERAAREAAVLALEAEKVNEALDRAAERAKYLAPESIVERASQDLEYVFDRFFDELPSKGGEAFANLFRNLGSVFQQAMSDALKAAFDPFVDRLRKALTAAVDKALGSFGKDGESGTGLLGALEKVADKVFGSGTGSKLGQIAKSATEAYANYSIGQMGVQALGLGGKTSAQQTNSQIGSAIGTALGTALGGPIGAIIGSFLGGAVGGLFGPSSTNAAASSLLDSKGNSTSGILGTKRTDETTNALTAGIAALQAGYQAITELGGTMTTYVRNLEIGQRDSSRVDLSNGQTVLTAVGDAEAAANAGLIAVLKGTTFANDALNRIKDGMIAAGASFDDTYVTLQKVDAVLKSSQPAVSEWAQALKDLDETFKPLIAATGAYSSAVRDAYETAKGALADAFSDSVAQRRLELEDPVGAQLTTVGKAVATLVKDAQALGVAYGQGSDVFAVVAGELQAVFENAFEGATGATDLSQQLERLKAVLQELGLSADLAAAAIDKAAQSTRDNFNEQVLSDIGNYLDGPVDQLNALLKSQADRLEKAKALGADLSQVERLTALEQREFFQGLSEDALKEVEGFLGLFEEATNSVVRNLDMSREDLRSRADTFEQFAQDFAQLRTDLTEQYMTASPRESIGVLRGRVEELLGGVAKGNESAAQALPQVINQLVEAARSTYGNTGNFADILAYAQSALSRAEQSAVGVKTEAERQIAALDESNDILGDIRDILASSQASNAFFQSYLNGGAASSDALLALIQKGAGLTPANDNASALTITGLIAQSVQPIITPLVNSIGAFTDRLSELPSLQRRTIEAVDRNGDRIVDALRDVSDRLDRLEMLEKKQLSELEQANRDVA